MKSVNIHEAKTHLSRLLERVRAGEEIVIARAGEPIARIVPYVDEPRGRCGGAWRGLVRIGADFDQPLPSEIASAFGGRSQ